MSRLRLLLLLFLIAVLAACTPRDPLDWKIDGRNANELQGWLDHTLEKMPAPLAEEFTTAVVRIRDTTHGWAKADPEATSNPLCLRLHGRTVRDVLVEGLQLQADDFAARVKNDKENILRFLQSTGGADLPPSDQERRQSQLARLRRQSELNERAYDALEKRIGQLLAPATQ